MPEIHDALLCRRSLRYEFCYDVVSEWAVFSEEVVERMTNLTYLNFDDYPMGAYGVHLGALWQLQDLTLGFLNQQPIIISDAARLTSLCTSIGRTRVLTFQHA